MIEMFIIVSPRERRTKLSESLPCALHAAQSGGAQLNSLLTHRGVASLAQAAIAL